mmetsp:Transcript_19538/g.57912  ORF Transcript_19538/g.57912 Transcript_19538/m.57912 type:complete len:170 (-) Transcript_19538:120-629(-)
MPRRAELCCCAVGTSGNGAMLFWLPCCYPHCETAVPHMHVRAGPLAPTHWKLADASRLWLMVLRHSINAASWRGPTSYRVLAGGPSGKLRSRMAANDSVWHAMSCRLMDPRAPAGEACFAQQACLNAVATCLDASCCNIMDELRTHVCSNACARMLHSICLRPYGRAFL